MSIRRINFTSSLLDGAKANTVVKKDEENNKEHQNSHVQEDKPEEVVQTNSEDLSSIPQSSIYEKPNHTLRNWSIGLSTAATLIVLGVAGRKGKLGEDIQKLLGGIKKDAKNLADDAGETLKDVPKVKSGGARSSSEQVMQYVDGYNVKPPAKDFEPVKIQNTEISLPKTADDIDVEKINAAFDRTLPHVDKSMFKVEGDIADSILAEAKNLKPQDIDPTKIVNGVYEYPLKDGTKLTIMFDSTNSQFEVITRHKDQFEFLGRIQYDKGKRVYAYDNIRTDYYNNDGTLSYIMLEVGGKRYKYNDSNRALERLTESDAKTGADKITCFDALGDVKSISYCIRDKEGYMITIKSEEFDHNNNLLSEKFFYTEEVKYCAAKKITNQQVKENYDVAVDKAKAIVEPRLQTQAEKMIKDSESRFYNDAVEYIRLFDIYEGSQSKFVGFFKRRGFSALENDGKYNVLSKSKTQIKLQNKQDGTTIVFIKAEGDKPDSLFVTKNGIEYNVEFTRNKKENDLIEISRNGGNERITYSSYKENKLVLQYYRPEEVGEIDSIFPPTLGEGYYVSYCTPAQIISGQKLPELNSCFFVKQ